MKQTIFLKLIFGAVIVVSATANIFGIKSDSKNPLITVGSVDLKRYAGKWYEVARLPNKFEKQCIGNVTAEYVLRENGKIEVTNRCDEANGKKTVAKGEARIQDKQTNAKLEVRFAPRFLSFIPAVWGDYWIIALDAEDYQYALVGDQSRNYLWLLSRNSQMSQAKYDELIKIAADKGFDTTKIVRTRND